MELPQLEDFLAVAEERRLVRAASRVGRARSAVSQNVKELEKEVGVPLFVRGIRELSLTEAGRAMVDSARRMLALRDDAIRRVGELRTPGSGTLTIAAHESAALYLLPAPLRRYFERFPRIKVGIHRRCVDEIPQQVMDGDLDVGLVEDEPLLLGLRSVLVYSDETILIASPRHPLAARRQVRTKDLSRESFLAHQLCVSTEQKILRFFESHRTRVHRAVELWNFESIKDFVQQDMGLAFVPRITVLHELRTGTLVALPLEEFDMPRRTFMVYRNSGYVSDTTQQFIDAMAAFRWDECLPSPKPVFP
jgi:DNA-binding transcriptional LysR family regulator